MENSIDNKEQKQQISNDFIKQLQGDVVNRELALKHYNELIKKNK